MKKYIIIVCAALMVAACGHKVDRAELLADIEQHEQEMNTSFVNYDADDIDSVCNGMIGLYRQFYTAFPTDSLAPVYMMRSADMLITLERTDEAVTVLDSIVSLHPEYGDVGGCWFLKGLAYENAELYDSARAAYTYFIDNYPDHYLAESTRNSLQYLGMSTEEMFEAIINAANDNGIERN